MCVIILARCQRGYTLLEALFQLVVVSLTMLLGATVIVTAQRMVTPAELVERVNWELFVQEVNGYLDEATRVYVGSDQLVFQGLDGKARLEYLYSSANNVGIKVGNIVMEPFIFNNSTAGGFFMMIPNSKMTLVKTGEQTLQMTVYNRETTKQKERTFIVPSNAK